MKWDNVIYPPDIITIRRTLYTQFYHLGQVNQFLKHPYSSFLTQYEIGDLVSPIPIKTSPKENEVEGESRRHPDRSPASMYAHTGICDLPKKIHMPPSYTGLSESHWLSQMIF